MHNIYHEITLKEKVDLDLHGLIMQYYEPILQKTGFIKIKRNLNDDTFNVYYKNGIYKFPNSVFASGVSINNANSVVHETTKWDENHGFDSIWHHEINDKKFRDVHTINLGYGYTSNNNFHPFISITLFPIFDKFHNIINLKDGDFLHLKTIKEISFIIPKYSENSNLNIVRERLVPKEINVEIKYNNLYLVPSDISQIKPTKELFEIYGGNDDSKDTYDYSVEIKKYSTSSLVKELHPYFEKATDATNFEGKKHLGTIKLYESTQYDYDKHITTSNISSNSQIGEIIPYVLRGDYKRQYSLKLNGIFKNLKINQVHNFVQPILDADDGQIILKINNNYKTEASKIKTINSDKLKYFNDHEFSLKGLERISDEQGI